MSDGEERKAEGAFNFNAPAELYPSRSRKGRNPFKYRRFDIAAEAVRFAIEELPAPLLLGTYLEVEEARFDGEEIRALYARDDYPLRSSKEQPVALDIGTVRSE